MRGIIGIFVFFLSVSASAQVRNWTAVSVPGARCGNGDQYKFFISQGTAKKVSIAFQGGGACWNYDTCFGLIKYTDLKGQNEVEDTGGFFSLSPQKSVAYDTTMIFMPYCTGDVFAGRHTASYGKKTVLHMGAENTELVFQYLKKNYGQVFDQATDLIVYGYSAGALGALTHALDIEHYFGQIPKKALLLDGPGLHFGETFWHKFTRDLIEDYSRSLSKAGLSFNYNKGLIAEVVPALCGKLPDWRVGVMQGTRDKVMSLVFGEISMEDHEALVLGSNGVYALTEDDSDNCSTWIPATSTHTFLNGNKSGLPLVKQVSVQQYAKEIVYGNKMPSYR